MTSVKGQRKARLLRGHALSRIMALCHKVPLTVWCLIAMALLTQFRPPPTNPAALKDQTQSTTATTTSLRDPLRSKPDREDSNTDTASEDQLRVEDRNTDNADLPAIDKEEHQEEEPEKKDIPNYNFADLSVEIADWEYFPDITKEQSVQEPDLSHVDVSKCSKPIPLDTSPPHRRDPSVGACDGYNGILHIQHADWGGGSGTVFFQFVVGMLQWADQHNYKPWVHMNEISIYVYDKAVHMPEGLPDVNFTMMAGMGIASARDARDPIGYKFPGRPQLLERSTVATPEVYSFPGTGIWEHYFEPVSDFSPGDASCTNKPYIRMEYDHILPGLHSQAPWAPHAWRYWMPEYMQQPNVPFKEWFAPQREHAAATTKRYIRLTPDLEQRALCAHPQHENSLGMHIRHGDKEMSRDYIPVDAFRPLCEAFVDNGGGSIYLATDSALVVETIMKEWPSRVSERIVRQPAVQGLSRNESAAFSLGLSEHLTNVEALVDARAMSKCTYLLHGLSALSEAAMYLNPALKPVNLEDPDEPAKDVNYFVTEVMGKKPSLESNEGRRLRSGVWQG